MGASDVTVAGSIVEFTCFGVGVEGARVRLQSNEIRLLGRRGQCDDVDYIRFFGEDIHILNNSLGGVDLSAVGEAHVDCMQTYDVTKQHVRRAVIDGNFCSDAHEGLMMSASEFGVSDQVVIRNNIFTRVTAWCVLSADISNVTFHNNTCDTRAGTHGMWCLGRLGRATCEFKNNIIFGPGTLYGVGETATLIDGTSAAPGRNNLVYKPGVLVTGYLNDLRDKDPLFQNPDAADFALRADSAARNAGINLSSGSPALDQKQKPRPTLGPWDIGALQFGTTPAPPTNLRPLP